MRSEYRLVLRYPTSSWLQEKKDWCFRGNSALCVGAINNRLYVPKGTKTMFVVFSDKRPRHKSFFELFKGRTSSYFGSWTLPRVKVRGYRGEYYFSALRMLDDEYYNNHARYVWFEVES